MSNGFSTSANTLYRHHATGKINPFTTYGRFYGEGTQPRVANYGIVQINGWYHQGGQRVYSISVICGASMAGSVAPVTDAKLKTQKFELFRNEEEGRAAFNAQRTA